VLLILQTHLGQSEEYLKHLFLEQNGLFRLIIKDLNEELVQNGQEQNHRFVKGAPFTRFLIPENQQSKINERYNIISIFD